MGERKTLTTLLHAVVGIDLCAAREGTERIVCAGWRPAPRMVETYPEFEALPLGSIVIETSASSRDWHTDECPEVWVHIAIDGTPFWLGQGDSDTYLTEEINLPVAVVWEPEVSGR